MSLQYDNYIIEHKQNVSKGYQWIVTNLPELIKDELGYEYQMTFAHDESKYSPDEYDAYDAYFYGGNRSFEVVHNFRLAWLHHIHNNPHHWQHWILINDDPGEGYVILDMPYNFILEMICDWWAFSWRDENLHEIFKWYDAHKDYMKLSSKTRTTVESILSQIKTKLEELQGLEKI